MSDKPFVVDCQSHVFPKAYAELYLRNTKTVRATKAGEDIYLLDYAGLQQFRLNLEDYAPERKLREMDEAGIDMSVLSVNMPGPENLDGDLALAGARICNDYLAELCARYPNRFAAIASLPMNDVSAAIAELDRAVDRLKLRGAFMFSHVAGQAIDSPKFEPFYAHLAQRQIPLVLHPTVPSWGEVVKDYSMIPMVGFMMDTSIAMLRLILGGVMERYPTLQVVHPHAGGVLPYVMGRVEEQTEVKRRGRDHIRQAPLNYYKRVFLDLVSPSAQTLRYAYEFAGVEQLLFASDHPWISLSATMETFNQLALPATERRKVLGENACRLFGI